MVACQTKANEQCVIVEIPYDIVASTSIVDGMMNGISVVQNGAFTYPFQVSYATFPGGGTSQLQYWNDATNVFSSFTPSQYSNVKLTIIPNDLDCDYIVMLCPRNGNTSMTIGDQTFEPYYQYYDLIDSGPTGNGLVLVPDSCFTAPACVNAPCDSTLGCIA